VVSTCFPSTGCSGTIEHPLRVFPGVLVRRLLSLESRWETEQWLACRGIPQNYSVEELETDQQTLESLFDDQS